MTLAPDFPAELKTKATEPADDPLCWRCGEPDSQHSWYGGTTLCDPFWEREGEDGLVYADLKRTFQPDPPAMTDEELINLEVFLHNTRDWVL